MKKSLLLLLLFGFMAIACGKSSTMMINDFETQKDLDRLTWRCPYWLEQTSDFVLSGQYGLSVELPAGIYPTLELREVPKNWSGYTNFAVGVKAPELAGTDLMIRIDDCGDSEAFADRFEASIPLTGEIQHIQLPLERIEKGNGGRKLDLRCMERVLFYLKSADKRHTIFLDGVRLTR